LSRILYENPKSTKREISSGWRPPSGAFLTLWEADIIRQEKEIHTKSAKFLSRKERKVRKGFKTSRTKADFFGGRNARESGSTVCVNDSKRNFIRYANSVTAFHFFANQSVSFFRGLTRPGSPPRIGSLSLRCESFPGVPCKCAECSRTGCT
jgi:hypothetical protein